MIDSTENKTHICHIVYRLDIGGLEKVIINLINFLPKKFVHTVICLEQSTNFASLINKNILIIELNKKTGIEVRTHWQIFNNIKKLRPDIVQTYNLPTIEYQTIAWLCRVPKRIHAEHGREINELNGLNKKRNILRKLAIPFCSQIITVSTDLVYWLINGLNVDSSKVKLIANGIDTEEFCPSKLANPTFIIGSVGRLDAVKNHMNIIHLCNFLRKNHNELFESIKFEIVGSGPMLDELLTSVKKHNLQNNIFFSGQTLDVANKLRSFSLYLHTSKYEAMPLTILEAMSCQLPVLAANVGGVGDIIEHNVNGELFEIDNVRQLSDAIVELYFDKGKRKSLSNNARCTALEKYSISKMIENYSLLYSRAD